MIRYICDNVIMPDFDEEIIGKWIKKVAAGYRMKTGNINYIFCSDQKILEVNNQFLSHDYFTDIITFDYSTEKLISGDIFISLDTVSTNATEFNVSFDKELCRILIHGILHLCGQDDQTPEERTEMIRKENEALGQLFAKDL